MGALLTTATTMQCPHGGSVRAMSTNTKAKAAGSYLLRSTDTFPIAACPLNIASAPHPCVRVQWVQTALKSKAIANPTLTTDSVGLCLAADGAVQGTVLVLSTQTQVSGR